MSVLNELNHQHDTRLQQAFDRAQEAASVSRLQVARGVRASTRHSGKRSRNFNCIADLTRFDVVFFAIGLVFIGFAIGLPVGIELAILDAQLVN